MKYIVLDEDNLNRKHGASVTRAIPHMSKEELVEVLGLSPDLLKDKNFAVAVMATEKFDDGFVSNYAGYHATNPDWSLRTIGISPTIARKITWTNP